MKTILLGLVAALVAAPLATAHISNDGSAGACNDNGDVHVHGGCYSIPGGLKAVSATNAAYPQPALLEEYGYPLLA